MRKFLFIAFVVFFCWADSHAMTDEQYEILKENSEEFATADKRLGNVFQKVKSALDEAGQKQLLQSQRKWIKTGWDEEAKKLIQQDGFTRTKAYTQAIDNRIEYLQGLLAEAPNKDGQAVTAATTPMPEPGRQPAAEEKTVTVEAEGTGATKMEALHAAWMEAVRKGVGIFMTSRTEAIDDNITEQIATHSRGQVNSFDVLSENKDGDLWTIAIRAKIDKDILQETAAGAQSQKVAFDGKNVAAKAMTEEEKKASQLDVLKKSADLFNFTKCLAYSAQSVKIGENFYMRHILKIDLTKYKVLSDQLQKVIASIAVRKVDVSLDVNATKKALEYLKPGLTPGPKSATTNKDIILDGYTFRYAHYRPYTEFSPRPAGNVLSEVNFMFFKNTGLSVGYILGQKVPQDMINTIPYKYQITFRTESDSGFDSVIAQNAMTLIFPVNAGSFFYICPMMEIKKNPSDYGYGGLFEFYQPLDLSKDQLLNIKELTGSYSLELMQ